MKIIAAAISVLFGAAFLAVEFILPYYPSLFGLGESVESVLSAEQSSARAAVYKLLINPTSAKFYAMRDVRIDTAKYVCGRVDSKDREGSYAGQHAFVYDDRSDSAVIDDAGRLISRPHAGFKPCPTPEEVKPGPLVVDLSKANAIAKVLPKPEIRGLSSLQSAGGGGDNSDAGQTMEQTLARLGPSDAGPNSAQAFNAADGAPKQLSATVAGESGWRSDQPPGAWPKFAAGDPLAKPGSKLSNGEALELASEIETRWKRFETGKSTTHPSVNEIDEARRALLAIKEQSAEFPQAWASFVRLGKIHRAATMLAERG
jgi:hypothetical protein